MGKQTRRSAQKHSSSRSRSSGHHAANKSMKKGKNTAGDSYFNDDDELRNFQKQLEPMGLMIRDVQGDGNCLFRALGDQLDGHDRNHLKHRQDTVKYISEHRSDFEPFMEDGIPFDQHVSNMMQPGTHAGNDALVAFARLHKVVVIIHQLGLPPWQIEGTDEKGARQLHISYHNGEHYASVRRFGDTSEMPTSVQLTEYSAGNDGSSSVCIEEVTDTVDSLEESSPPTESSTDGSDVGLWAPNGTGTRLFGGDSQPKAADTGGKKTTLTKKQQKALSKSQKKDLRRMERQQRRAASTSKAGTAAPPSAAEESTVVMSRDLSLLKI